MKTNMYVYKLLTTNSELQRKRCANTGEQKAKCTERDSSNKSHAKAIFVSPSQSRVSLFKAIENNKWLIEVNYYYDLVLLLSALSIFRAIIIKAFYHSSHAFHWDSTVECYAFFSFCSVLFLIFIELKLEKKSLKMYTMFYHLNWASRPPWTRAPKPSNNNNMRNNSDKINLKQNNTRATTATQKEKQYIHFQSSENLLIIGCPHLNCDSDTKTMLPQHKSDKLLPIL